MRKLSLVTVAAISALTLTACDSTTTTATSTTNSTEPTTAEVTTTAAEKKIDSLQALSEAVTTNSAKAKSAHGVFSGETIGMPLSGDGDFAFSATKTEMQIQMTVGKDGLRFEAKHVDNETYIRMGGGPTPGGKWLRIKAGDPGNPAAAPMEAIKSIDPTQMLRVMVKAGKITSATAEPLNGQDTQHYKIVADPAKLDGTAMGMSESATKSWVEAGVREIPFDVWLNGDNLPIRFVMELPNTLGGKPGRMQADYTDWGKPVDIKAPPAGEIAERPGG